MSLEDPFQLLYEVVVEGYCGYLLQGDAGHVRVAGAVHVRDHRDFSFEYGLAEGRVPGQCAVQLRVVEHDVAHVCGGPLFEGRSVDQSRPQFATVSFGLHHVEGLAIAFLVQGGRVDVAAAVPRASAPGVGEEFHSLAFQFGFCSNDSDFFS